MKTPISTVKCGRGERGAVMILMAVLAGLFVALAALAVDGSHMISTETLCQSTADGAALAAASQLPEIGRAARMGIEFAEKNMPTAEHGQALRPADIVTGRWDSDTRTFTAGAFPPDAVQVTVRRAAANGNPLGLTFGAALGFASTDIVSQAVATKGSAKQWDMSIAQDVTLSFMRELGDARLADMSLIECMNNYAHPDTLVGLVSFGGNAVISEDLMKVSVGFSTLYDAAKNTSLCGRPGAPNCDGTDIAEGLKLSVGQLLASTSGVDQAIVLVSDGQPNEAIFSKSESTADRESDAILWADKADAAGISIFCVFYDDGSDADAATFLESLVRGEGRFLSTPDPAELPDLLLEVCNSALPLNLVD